MIPDSGNWFSKKGINSQKYELKFKELVYNINE